MSQAIVASEAGRRRWILVSALGICQILAWGSSYYLLAVLELPIARDTGWSPTWIVRGLSLGLLVSGVVSPRVGRAMERFGGRPGLMVSAVLLALGLLGPGLAPNLPSFVAAWVLVGCGMGGLYDASSSASVQNVTSMVLDRRHDSTRRLCQSMIATRYRKPRRIGM